MLQPMKKTNGTISAKINKMKAIRISFCSTILYSVFGASDQF